MITTFHKFLIGASLLWGEFLIFCWRTYLCMLLYLSMNTGWRCLPHRPYENILLCHTGAIDITALFTAYLMLDDTPSLAGLDVFLKMHGRRLDALTLITTYKNAIYHIHIPSEGHYVYVGEQISRRVLFGSLRLKDLYHKKLKRDKLYI